MNNKYYSWLLGTGVMILLITHYLDNYSHPETLIPYPYKVSYALPLDHKQISKADILIIGDRMGKRLARFEEQFNSKNLTKKLTLFDWTSDNEPIYRTVAKLKTLKKLPPIIIYHGGSSELYESHFNIKDEETIKKNFEIHNDTILASAIMAVPFLSRLLYTRPIFFKIDGNSLPKISEEILASSEMQAKLELKYMLYEIEIDQLIKIIQRKDSRPIIISTPINYLTMPKVVCANSTSATIDNELNKIEQLFNKGDYKSAYSIVSELVQLAIGNAKVLYWFGKLLKYTGNNREAFKMLKAASALDCSSWRGSSIFNVIMSRSAIKHGARFIDFDKIVHQSYWNNTLFLDEMYPQNIQYENLAVIIAKQIDEIITN